MIWLKPVLGIAAAGFAGLSAWRVRDHRLDKAETERLKALQPLEPSRFSRDMITDLPEPAQRFFTFAIAEGTPLYTVAELEMEGEFGMGDKATPNYLAMRATQILAMPHGFIWKMSGGRGAMRMSGSDTASWTRFWLAGLVPVARLGVNADHARSAFGRYVAEAVFWTPAALLPGPGITWEPVTDMIARVTVSNGDLAQAVDLTVAQDGSPVQVEFQRWSNSNPDRVYRLKPFGGYLSEFEEVQGFRLPTKVEAGNFFGTEDYFPFFRAKITSIRFPDPNRG